MGVACGPAGLVVIDIDAHPQTPPARDQLLPGIPIPDQIDLSGLATGYHTIGILAALRGATSPADDTTTLRVRTPSGGLHVWYQDARTWQCSTGSSAGRALAWQVDVRAHGGYIVAPGTTTRAGTYTPVGIARTPAPLPPWLAHELERTGHQSTPTPHIPAPRPVPARALQAVIAAGGGRDHASRILAKVLADVAACATISSGAGFSDKLNRAAFTAGGLVAGGHLPVDQAEHALKEAAELARPGQSRRSDGIIHSGMSAGRAHPLQLGTRP